MENFPGHNAFPGAAVLCLPSTETTFLFQKCFVCLSKVAVRGSAVFLGSWGLKLILNQVVKLCSCQEGW